MAIEETTDKLIEVPAPTAWPMIMALGLTLSFAGLVTNVAVSMVGLILFTAGAVGWFREVLPIEHRESVHVEPAVEAIVPAEIGVDYLHVGELGNRAILPLEIYPYSAGIKGGIAGGVVMAVLAALQGIALHGSPWYTVNILAATAMPSLANASTATLSSFIPEAFFVAVCSRRRFDPGRTALRRDAPDVPALSGAVGRDCRAAFVDRPVVVVTERD
jgi:hypothetical protein